jgi:hypothetical protein
MNSRDTDTQRIAIRILLLGAHLSRVASSCDFLRSSFSFVRRSVSANALSAYPVISSSTDFRCNTSFCSSCIAASRSGIALPSCNIVNVTSVKPGCNSQSPNPITHHAHHAKHSLTDEMNTNACTLLVSLKLNFRHTSKASGLAPSRKPTLLRGRQASARCASLLLRCLQAWAFPAKHVWY